MSFKKKKCRYTDDRQNYQKKIKLCCHNVGRDKHFLDQFFRSEI